MKKSKNLSLFRPSIIFLIFCFYQNIYFLIISTLFLLLIDYRESLLLIFFTFIYIILNNILFDFIPFGYIENISNKYIVVNKFLYKTKIFINVDYLRIGNFVKTSKNSILNIDLSSLKNNIRFINYDDIKLIKYDTFFYANHAKLLNYENSISSLLSKLVFNEYVDNNEIEIFTGYGLSSYFFLKFIYRKNKKLSILISILISILFGFEIKYMLIFIDYIISFISMRKKDSLSLKLIIILFINKYLLLNYSFLITLLFSFINIIDVDFKTYISIIQSVLFGEINIFFSFFYKYFVFIQVIIYTLCLIIIFIPTSSNFVYSLIILISKFIINFSFSIRGKLNILFIFLILFIEKHLNIKSIAYILCLLVLISPFNNPFTHVSFIDVGQGDSILIKDAFNNYNVLIDTGSKYNYNKLKTFLYKEGIYTLDYLIITHNDSDHNGNINNLCKDFEIKEIINKPIDIEIGDLFLKNLNFENYDNDNENSLVYYTNIKDLSFIFAGDITKNVERLLVNKYHLKNVDVLKVSHHGSNTGTSRYFVSNLLPKIAIISTNGNYGHPKKEVIDTLDSFLVKTYITKNDGNITLYLTKKIYIVKTDIFHFDIITS